MSSSAWSRLVRSTQKKAASGWFSAEPDGFIRGWCVDRAQLDRRLDVAILIDGTLVAELPADRPHARLAELGEGDGNYGFICVVPKNFRDGIARRVEVRIVTPGYESVPMKTRADEVLLDAGLPIPRVAIKSVTGEWIDGVLSDVQSRKHFGLDVWIGDSRVPEDHLSIQWTNRSDQSGSFRVRLNDRSPLALLGECELSYPGVKDVLGDGVELASTLQAEITATDSDTYRVAIGSRVVIPDGHVLLAQVLGGGEVLSEFDLAFRRNAARFSLPPERGSLPRQLKLLTPERVPFADAGTLPRTDHQRNFVDNCTFARWSGDAPDSWSVPEGIACQRGFYAFTEDMRQQAQLSGQTFVGHVAASSEVLLRQPLRRAFPAGETEVHFGILARASQLATVGLRLVAADGAIHASCTIEIATQWTQENRRIVLGAGPMPDAGLMLEVWIRVPPVEEPVYVEFAGVRVGEESSSFGESADRGGRMQRRFGENLVVNAGLSQWPNGLSFSDIRRRFEIAQGWHLYNKKVTSEAKVAATPALLPNGTVDAGSYALCLAVDKVEEHCRIEVTLATETLRGELSLRFNAMAGTIFDPPTAHLDRTARWGSIDRISLARRTVSFVDGERLQTDQVVAVLARRVVLTRKMTEFEYDIAIDSELGDEDDALEYSLMFEFNKPVALTIGSVNLRLAQSGSRAADLPAVATGSLALRLEDPNIIGQASSVRGLEEWVSDRPVSQAANIQAAAPRAEISRWSWRYSSMGSVEIVVCVYNAIEDTLACLRSLIGTTSIPHTVRIVNDSSDRDSRERLVQFVADRPWMKLVDNPENLGYTASADKGIRESDADWVALINSDAIVTKGWLEGFLDVAATDPQIALVGPVSNAATYQSVPELYDGSGKWAINALPPGWTVADMAAFVARTAERGYPRVPLLNGFCTLIKRNVFLEIGGFDIAKFPLGYGEENDMCLRAAKAGYRLAVADHVYIYHAKSQTFGSVRRQELSRAGDKVLRQTHDDVNVGNLGRQFAEIPALAVLRDRVRKAYAEAASRPYGTPAP